jgi:hypothetical protein
MPLETYRALEAMAMRRRNDQSRPPARGPNGIAKTLDIRVNPGFRIKKSSSVFTVGSCFARNVEFVLEDFGFKLPAIEVPRQYLKKEQRHAGMLNKYTPTSIANEIRWALDDFKGTPLEAAIIQCGDKYWDSQLHARNDLQDFDFSMARRIAANETYKSLVSCDVAIITFGLVETWRDTNTSLYLNEAPPASMLRGGERFEFNLFSFHDCLSEGRYILNKIFEVNPSCNVIVTVSPVSLQATFSSESIISRNCYSKSVLRAVVEHLRAEFSQIDYYPSYERVIYADRQYAFLEDEIHVTRDHVNHTIVSMLEQYLDGDIKMFPSGSLRLWWKEVYEGNREKAQSIWQESKEEIIDRARVAGVFDFRQIKSSFDSLMLEDPVREVG